MAVDVNDGMKIRTDIKTLIMAGSLLVAIVSAYLVGRMDIDRLTVAQQKQEQSARELTTQLRALELSVARMQSTLEAKGVMPR